MRTIVTHDTRVTHELGVVCRVGGSGHLAPQQQLRTHAGRGPASVGSVIVSINGTDGVGRRVRSLARDLGEISSRLTVGLMHRAVQN